MPEVMEVPPVTRREIEVARRWAARAEERAVNEPVPQLEVDLLLCLDLIALLRADLGVAVIRATVWARCAAEHQAAAEDLRAERSSHAVFR